MSRIEFVGLVVRTADGKTRALDLSAEDLDLTVDIDIPERVDDEVTTFGRDDWANLLPPDRVNVAVAGRRRPGAEKLCTYRVVEDGEPPFPAWERAE